MLGAFSAYYTYFLCSVFYELFGPNARWCGTPQVWALQGAAMFFAPPALLGSIGLWFLGRKGQTLGRYFSTASRIESGILIFCVVGNLLIFIPPITTSAPQRGQPPTIKVIPMSSFRPEPIDTLWIGILRASASLEAEHKSEHQLRS